jgi:hypothetical protein
MASRAGNVKPAIRAVGTSTQITQCFYQLQDTSKKPTMPDGECHQGRSPFILDRQRAVKNKSLLPDHTVSLSQGRVLVIQLLIKSPVELFGSNSLPLLLGPTLSANHNSLFENAQRKSQYCIRSRTGVGISPAKCLKNLDVTREPSAKRWMPVRLSGAPCAPASR